MNPTILLTKLVGIRNPDYSKNPGNFHTKIDFETTLIFYKFYFSSTLGSLVANSSGFLLVFAIFLVIFCKLFLDMTLLFIHPVEDRGIPLIPQCYHTQLTLKGTNVCRVNLKITGFLYKFYFRNGIELTSKCDPQKFIISFKC